MAGTATCSGEGGMIPDERRYSIEVALPVHPVALRLQSASLADSLMHANSLSDRAVKLASAAT